MSRLGGELTERRVGLCEISIAMQAKTCLARGTGIATGRDYQTKTRRAERVPHLSLKEHHMPSFKDLKVGDEVFVVWQQSRHAANRNLPIRTDTLPVSKVGRKYGYVMMGHSECPFELESGASHHDPDHNSRANGYGFDVYHSREEWDAEVHANAERVRLSKRLTDGQWRLSIRPSPEAVADLHAVLDKHGL